MNKKFFIAAALLLIALALVFFVVWPAFAKWNGARADLAMMRAENQAITEALDLVVGFDEAENFAEVAKLQQAMPQDAGTQELLVTLENMATTSGLLLSAVDFSAKQSAAEKLINLDASQQAATSASGLAKITISVELTGSYSAFKTFLQSLEKNIRVLNVNKITFSKIAGLTSQQGPLSDVFRYSVEIETYYLKAKAGK